MYPMTKTRLIPFLIFLFVISSFGSTRYLNQDNNSLQATDSVYAVVDKEPEFPGGTSAKFKFLANNLLYPQEALTANQQGRVIVQFVVTKGGKVTNVKAVKSITSSLDEEAVRIVSLFPDWTPGELNGEKVSSYQLVPVTFKFDNLVPPTKFDVLKDSSGVAVFATIDQMPQFNGGVNDLLQYLGQNLRYPSKALDIGLQGRVFVQFVVSSNGKVQNAKIVQESLAKITRIDEIVLVSNQGLWRSKQNLSHIDILEKEALRLVNSIPVWTPGKQGDVNISVYYTLPISFKIDK